MWGRTCRVSGMTHTHTHTDTMTALCKSQIMQIEFKREKFIGSSGNLRETGSESSKKMMKRFSSLFFIRKLNHCAVCVAFALGFQQKKNASSSFEDAASRHSIKSTFDTISFLGFCFDVVECTHRHTHTRELE